MGDDRACWAGWSLVAQSIDYVPDGCAGQPALKYSVPESSWNCPIINFPQPLRVTENTVVRFSLKCPAGRLGMIVKNQVEEAEYYLSFVAPAGGSWFTVQKYLSGGAYKRFGRPDVPKDGLVGDTISSIMVTSAGTEIQIGDFQIVEAAESLPETPEETPLFAGTYAPIAYPGISTFFPFGVIYQAGAGTANGEFFAQGSHERYEMAAADLKRHSMNVFANFCDGDEVDYRLGLCHTYNLRLIETRLTGAGLASVVEGGDYVQLIQRHAADQHLLAWYGQADEPTDFKLWLDYKIAINKLDPNHPVASCLNEGSAVKALGPYSELVMLDIYSVTKDSRGVGGLVSHADSIRMAKTHAVGKKVWLVTQAYGDRSIFRYPTAEEIRFDVFNAISAGVDGIAFFIYNDVCHYLDKPTAREKFDSTLVDPWFNDNPTYRELARLGREVIPIMPSLLGAQDSAALADRIRYAKGGLVYGRFDKAFGTFVVVANMSLDGRYRGTVDVSCRSDQHAYNLLKLAPAQAAHGAALELDLAAGDGAIYLIATNTAWNTIRAEILTRKLTAQIELLELDAQALRDAGLKTASLGNAISRAKRTLQAGKVDEAGKTVRLAGARRVRAEESSPIYVRQRDVLETLRAGFGEIHSAIKTRIEILDGSRDPDWVERFGRIRTTSSAYFRLRRAWKSGDFANDLQLVALQHDVTSLKDEVVAAVERLGEPR
jgi:hypothetical protein